MTKSLRRTLVTTALWMTVAACETNGASEVVDGEAGDGPSKDAAASADVPVTVADASVLGGAGGSVAGGAAGADAAVRLDGTGSDARFDAPTPLNPDGPAPALRKLDILVLVDNSGSMSEEQQALKTTFPTLIRELERLPGGLPDLHLAVISSDVGAGGTPIPGNPACNRFGGDRGRMDPMNKAPGCGVQADAHYLVTSGATKNFTGDLATVFGCMAQLGTTGCGFEHQLQSARLSLVENFNRENNGFLRDDAYLLIILLTDEDDCSADPRSELFAAGSDRFPNQSPNARCAVRGHVCGGQPVPNGVAFTAPLASCTGASSGRADLDLIPLGDFVDFFRSLKRDPRQVLVSAIVGAPLPGQSAPYAIAPVSQAAGPPLLDLSPICVSAAGSAAPALRIKSFVDSFGPRGLLESICQGDLAPTLARIGKLVRDTAM